MKLDLLDEIRERAGEELPYYSSIAEKAFSEIPPVFFMPEYEDFFWQCATTIPNWLPRVVAACAITEGAGAHSLLDIWSRVHAHPDAERGLLQHAKDEAAHARLFVKLARLAFEDNYPNGNLTAVEDSLIPISTADIVKKTENSISDRMLIDYCIQLNIVEVRTRKHLLMMAPMYYALSPEENKPKVEKILHALARDEMTHIVYTARLIDEYASDAPRSRIDGVFKCRLHNYNEHTIEHCDAAKHDYGQGKIPMLFAPSCGNVCKLGSRALDHPS